MSKSIFEAYNHCKKELLKAGVEDVGLESRMIIRHITGYNNAQILTHYTEKLTPFQENNLIALIHQRSVRYPLQYIFGTWNFYGLEFKVGPGVLIPRDDTETLVDTALEFLENKPNADVLDLCAGSGCIGITVADRFKDAKVTLVEKYNEAFTYLEKNIAQNNAENATAVLGDVLEGDMADGKYDIILSNPPYITRDELALMSPETKFEPETALFAEGDGLVFYRTIAEKYKKSLKKGGKLCFEVGFTQSAAVCEILREAGFSNVDVKKDLEGIERVVFGTADFIE